MTLEEYVHAALENPTGGCLGLSLTQKEFVHLPGSLPAVADRCRCNLLTDVRGGNVESRKVRHILVPLHLARTYQNDSMTTVDAILLCGERSIGLQCQQLKDFLIQNKLICRDPSLLVPLHLARTYQNDSMTTVDAILLCGERSIGLQCQQLKDFLIQNKLICRDPSL